MATGWKSLQGYTSKLTQGVTQGVQGIDISGVGNRVGKGFSTLSQQVRESVGQAEGDDVTELPEDYKNLERRVDALRNAHTAFLKIAKAYDSETYDYPTQINESITELSTNITHTVSVWTATATKGTNLPQPTVADKAPVQHKTLPHALSRAAANGAVELTAGNPDDRLGAALQKYALAADKVGAARLEQDHTIQRTFTSAWSATLNQQIGAAMKSRANVKTARLQLDASRARAKSVTGGPKAEQLRLDIEAAEETLVNATEDSINQMRAVLEAPSSLVALSHFIKAQQTFHAKAAEALAAIEADIEEAATAAEGDFRKTRS